MKKAMHLNNKGFSLVTVIVTASVGSIMILGMNTAIFKLAKSQAKISDTSDLTWLINTAQLKLEKWNKEKEEDSTKEHTYTFSDPDKAEVKISKSDDNYEACFEAVKEAVPIPEHLKDKYEWVNLIDGTDPNNKFIIANKETPTIAAYNKEIIKIKDRCEGTHDYSIASIECYEVNDSNPSDLDSDPDKKRQSLIGCGEGTTNKEDRPIETTLFGFEAGNNITESGNTFVGYKTYGGPPESTFLGHEIRGAKRSIIIGHKARGSTWDIASGSVGIGAGERSMSYGGVTIGAGDGGRSYGKVTIGAGARSTRGSLVIGKEAGSMSGGVLLPVGLSNILIGQEAGMDLQNDEDAFSIRGLIYRGTGRNTYIGYKAGKGLKGESNILIGSNQPHSDYNPFDIHTKHRLNIGHLITGYGVYQSFTNRVLGHRTAAATVGHPYWTVEKLAKFNNRRKYHYKRRHVRIRGDLIVDGNIILTKNSKLLKHNRYRDVDDHHHPVLQSHTHTGGDEEENHVPARSHPSLNLSDKRLKKNIKPLSNSLSKLLKLKPSSYYWKDKTQSKKKQLGFIAQDIKKEYPELVDEGTDKKKLLSLNYIGLIPVIIKSFKEFYHSVTKSLFHIRTELSEIKISFLETEKKIFRELDTLREESRDILKRIEKLEAKNP